MPLKESLAAVVRLVRRSRGLNKDDLQGVLDQKHIYNLENARSSVTLDTLEELACALGIDPLTLLTVAASLDRSQSHEQLLEHLGEQGNELDAMGIMKKRPSEFQVGILVPMPAGRRTPLPKIQAILACRKRGMSQKEASQELGISTSTVSRNWNRGVE
jgi:transcriptional regulator with XRE-family HTH domain